MSREAIIAALELEADSCCLDDEADREHIADRVLAVLRNQLDALVVREFFANSPTDGTRLIAFTASHGRVQSIVLEAAYRLAGGKP
jgi:hypothetical protein